MDSHHHQEGSHDCGQSCDSLKILESCALPGQFTTRLVTKSEASHTAITLYPKNNGKGIIYAILRDKNEFQ